MSEKKEEREIAGERGWYFLGRITGLGDYKKEVKTPLLGQWFGRVIFILIFILIFKKESLSLYA